MTSLVIAGPGGQIVLDEENVASIGRDASCSVRVADDRVSRRHGLVRFDRGWVYQDLASSNGSFVDGVRIENVRVDKTAALRLGNANDGPMVYLQVRTERSTRITRLFLTAVVATLLIAMAVWGASGALSGRAAISGSPIPVASASSALLRTDIVASGKTATVMILQGNGQGSGVYLGSDRILTALHVVPTTAGITISLNDRTVGSAQVIATDPQDDLALLLVPGLEAAGARPVTWGDSDKLREGDELIVLGYPVGLPFSVKVGVVSGLRTDGTTHLIQTDASLNPGMSGGPAFDPSGLLVGITDFGSTRYAGLNFLVASSSARRFADDHR